MSYRIVHAPSSPSTAYVRDCRRKYVLKFEGVLEAFLDVATICNQYDTCFIKIHSVEADLQFRR